MNLRDIVQEKCIPSRDCMLTISDINGETAFLYFKEAELIEANYATYWGKEALAEVINWNLLEYTVTPLPLGIKRSLWDTVDNLLQPRFPGASDTITPSIQPTFAAAKAKAPDSLYEEFKELPGVTQLLTVTNGKVKSVFEKPNEPVEQTAWLEEFMSRAKALGETLGFGKIDQFCLTTDRYYMMGFRFEDGHLGILRKHAEGLDDFEAACQASMKK
jgi:hypothetical protein